MYDVKVSQEYVCLSAAAQLPVIFGAVKPTTAVERIAGSDEVRGSSPLFSTNTTHKRQRCRFFYVWQAHCFIGSQVNR